jgi:hypothetical protein
MKYNFIFRVFQGIPPTYRHSQAISSDNADDKGIELPKEWAA